MAAKIKRKRGYKYNVLYITIIYRWRGKQRKEGDSIKYNIYTYKTIIYIKLSLAKKIKKKEGYYIDIYRINNNSIRINI